MPSRDRLAGSWQLLSSIGHRKYDFLAVVPFIITYQQTYYS